MGKEPFWPPKPRTPMLIQSVVSEREGVRVDDIWTRFNNYTDEQYLTGWRLYRKVDEGETEYVADVEAGVLQDFVS